jgi:hypothetical protein
MQRICFACWIRMAADTHSWYVVIMSFSRRQWLHERPLNIALFSNQYGHMAFNSGAALSRSILKSYSGCNPKSCDPLLERHGMSQTSRFTPTYALHLWRRRYVASTTYTIVDWPCIQIISSPTCLHHPWWFEDCDAFGRPICSATRWLTNNCTVCRPFGHVGESS